MKSLVIEFDREIKQVGYRAFCTLLDLLTFDILFIFLHSLDIRKRVILTNLLNQEGSKRRSNNEQ